MLRPLLPLVAFATLVAAGCGNEHLVATDTVVMKEYEFVPKSVSIERGAALTVRNEGDIAHNLVIERSQNPLGKPHELLGTDTFLGGRERKLRVDLQPGRYTIICSVPGHRQLGMYGTLTVR